MNKTLTLLAALTAIVCNFSSLHAEPTQVREWTAITGHKLEGKALQVSNGKVQFERENGSKLAVDLAKLSSEDQAFLKEHFSLLEAPNPSEADLPAAGEPADNLPHPLGEVIDNVQATEKWSYMLYLPKSLRKDEEYPVLFLMDPGGGNIKAVNRYLQGAERNGWIIAHSKQSKNGFSQSQVAIDAMIEHVTDELPIDENRMYTTGFSGGSRMAFNTAQKHKKIAGVIPCGAGGNPGSSKQVVYGVCGTNCFNRSDMANSFRGIKSKDSVLRYFPGRHSWANGELFEDAITHLNGIFLIKNARKYPEPHKRFLSQVMELVNQNQESNPMRAILWTDYLQQRDQKPSGLETAHTKLSEDPANLRYLEGLSGVHQFALDTFGDTEISAWKISEKQSTACLAEATKYSDTPWAEILEKMSEDAQKF